MVLLKIGRQDMATHKKGKECQLCIPTTTSIHQESQMSYTNIREQQLMRGKKQSSKDLSRRHSPSMAI